MTESKGGRAHLEADLALSLATLLGDAGQTVDHLAGCGECSELLRDLGALRATLAEEPVRSGFADEVLAALPPRERPVLEWGWRLLNAGLTFAAAVFVLRTLGAGASPAAVTIAAGSAGLVALLLASQGRGVPEPE